MCVLFGFVAIKFSNIQILILVFQVVNLRKYLHSSAKSTTYVTQAGLGVISSHLQAVLDKTIAVCLTELLTELFFFKSGAPTQQDAVGGNQPKIFAAKSTNPLFYFYSL